MGRAAECQVSDIVAVSVDLESMVKVLEIARSARDSQGPKVHPALGVHPGKVNTELKPAFDFMAANVKQATAVGETGLDYWYQWVRKDMVERQKQKDSFAFHLALANEFDRPIIIHSRGAWRDCLQMTKDAGVKRALFHWYSGPVDILDGILGAGYYVSTGPSVAYSPESRRAMAHAPLERIMLETDSPVTYRDKDGEAAFQAEPKDVVRACAALAQLKNIGEGEALAASNKNAKDFFRI